MDLPHFSVVVPSYDRLRDLQNCLASLAALEYPADRFEVIVVDDGSPSPVSAALSAPSPPFAMTVLRRARGGPAAARNTGLEAASGEFVAFTADDCRPRPDWLSALAARFAADSSIAVGGRIVNQEVDNLYSTSTDLLLRHLYEYYNAAIEDARFFTPNNLAFPLEALREMGGFRTEFVTGEDRELCDRWRIAGRRLVYAHDAVVDHRHPLDLAGFCHLHYRYGRGSRRFRQAAALRNSKAADFEPISFYLGLIRYPLSRSHGARAIAISGLLCVAQLANAVGYLRQRFGPQL
ncbi:MAG TPA: glycosyltransferase [Gemmatimonadota bacterium]|nr:glycosyltransferase [Gemmatimonadota bacterium]